jgi:hypothetical protein
MSIEIRITFGCFSAAPPPHATHAAAVIAARVRPTLQVVSMIRRG